jgi:hypothetical protein
MYRHLFSLRFINFTPFHFSCECLGFLLSASCIVPFLFDKLGFLSETMGSGLRVDLRGVTSLLVTWMARQAEIDVQVTSTYMSERTPRCKDSVWSIHSPEQRFHRSTYGCHVFFVIPKLKPGCN